MYTEIVIRFLLAALWGGIVGIEREYRGKAAGFRTMIMISIGACFFTIMSDYIGGKASPDHIAANIVTGIGFLGAGVIFRGDNRVNGITTATAIWVVAAVGMGIGAGHYFAAACASLLVVAVLAILPKAERWIDQVNQTKKYTIQTKYTPEVKFYLEERMAAYQLHYKLIGEIKDGDTLVSNWQLRGKATEQQRFISAMQQDETISRFEY